MVKVLKNKYFWIPVVTLILFAFFWLTLTQLVLQPKEHNGKIAVLVDSGWNYNNGWPETDYLAIQRETISALEYLGYRFDLVNEKTATGDLSRYALLISVAGVHGEEIIKYTKESKRTVLILYDLGPKLFKNLGVSRGEFVLEAKDGLGSIKESILTQGTTSKYGALPLWGAYEHKFGPKSKVLLKTTDGLPVLIEQKGFSGRYIFLLTRALTWNAYSYRFLDNVIQEATDLSRVGSIPYAMDVPVIVRLDDYCTWDSYWQDYINLSKKLTVTAIMNEVNQESISKVLQNGVEIVPHGYVHEDLSKMTYLEQKRALAQALEKYRNFTGSEPEGYVAPYNRINGKTTQVCTESKLGWITTYHGMAKIPRHYYTDHPNKVWVLGARPEYITDIEALQEALEEGGVEKKPLMFVEQISARKQEGRIDHSLAALKYIIGFINTRDGFYLSGLGEYFKFIKEQRLVYQEGEQLIVEGDVGSGLTFTYPECGSNRMMKVGNKVLMFYRQGATVLPALKKGIYPLNVVQDMPILQKPGPGVIVKSAVYDTVENTGELLLEAFVEKKIEIRIENIPPGQYLAEITDTAGNKAIQSLTISDKRSVTIAVNLSPDVPVTIHLKNQLP